MTAKALLYAVGGGWGHAKRAFVLAESLETLGYGITIVLSPNLKDFFSPKIKNKTLLFERWNSLNLKFSDYQLVIVDTFPRGTQQEIQLSDLLKIEKRILITRINTETQWEKQAAVFSDYWSPYPDEYKEWTHAFSDKEKSLGWVVGPSFSFEKGKALLIVDPRQLLPSFLRKRFAHLCKRSNLDCEIEENLIPEKKYSAKKILWVGAGYNSIYEHVGGAADIKFIPLKRRFDNQFSRAKKWNCDFDPQFFVDWISRESVEEVSLKKDVFHEKNFFCTSRLEAYQC